MAKSFAVPYQGDTAVLFRQNLEMIPTRPHFYSNVVPVCQTSAGGKSRLVDELAKLVTSIPINLLDILEEEHSMCYTIPFHNLYILTWHRFLVSTE